MKYTTLGNTGLQISRLCLGCMTYGTPKWREWVLDEEASVPLLKSALDAGINFFDTANMYSLGVSEEILGRFIKAHANRDEVVIATKVFFPFSRKPNAGGLSRKHIMQAVDDSLRRLGTDYIDLYQIHRCDPRTPMEETAEALGDLVKMGKVRYLGASSMYAWQLMKYRALQKEMGAAQFVSMQSMYNLLYREEEREMIPLCRDQGVGMIPWSPLARGMLAGSKAAGTTRSQSDEMSEAWFTSPANDLIINAVAEVAAAHGVKPAQIALAWVMREQQVSAPIIGASKPGHIEDAVAALELELSDEDVAKLEAPYITQPTVAF